MQAPSCAAAVETLLNDHALSTQTHRSAHTFHDPSPSCPATITTIDYVFVRVDRAPSPYAPALS